MKSIYIAIAIILITLTASFAYYYFPKTEEDGSYLILLIDLTDKDTVELNAHDVVSLATNSFLSKSEITIQTESLSEYQTNAVKEFHLPKEGIITGNSMRRKRAINKLARQVDTTVRKMYSQQTARSQSKLFLPFLNAVNDLSKRNAQTKTIVCASDLTENNKAFSCYNPKSIQLLKKDPHLVETTLLQGSSLNNYRGISIYLIHHPRNERDDEMFYLMANFYKQLYERKGATVYIQSDLHIQYNSR